MRKKILALLTICGTISLIGLVIFQYFMITNTMAFYDKSFENTIENVITNAEQETKEEEIHRIISELSPIEQDSIFSAEKFCLKPNEDLFDRPTSKRSSIMSINLSYMERYRQRYEENRKLVERVLTKMMINSEEQTLFTNINYNIFYQKVLDGLLSHNINDKFSIRITSPKGSVLFKTTDIEPDKRNRIIRHEAFRSPDGLKSLIVEMTFTRKNSYRSQFIQTVTPTIVLSGILFLLIIGALFIFMIQKRDAEVKADFMNNMTHELKTPLASISLASQMLNDQSVKKSPERMTMISNIIRDETQRLGALIDKVLQASIFKNEHSSLNLKEYNTHDIIEQVIKNFSIRVSQNNGNINADLAADNPFAMVDFTHFTNVIYNLCENAIKYTPKDLVLNINTWNEKNKLYISVSDNGIGIKKEDQKRIFNQFFRVSTGNVHNVKGFGLGLAYVKKIVKDHQGKIWVESEFGIGSKFIIEIPCIDF